MLFAMKLFITLLMLLALPLTAARAQTTVSGRILDARTHKPLDGAEVRNQDPYGGGFTLTDATGTFTLPTRATDSVSLHVQCLGCYRYPRVSVARTARRRASDTLTIYLASQTDPNPGCCPAPEQRLTLGGRSGVLHTPFGLYLRLPTGHRTATPAAWLSAAFQTDGRGTQRGTATWLIGRHPFWYRRPLRLGATYQRLRLPGARRFDSGAAVAEWRGEWAAPWPGLRAPAGYARRSPSPDTRTAGFGGGLGLSGGLKRLHYAAQATRWPGYWQWQAQLSRPVGRLECTLEYERLSAFEEVTLGVTFAPY